jgi:hypothetical protein
VGTSAGHVVVTAAQHRRDGKCNCPGCRMVLGNKEKIESRRRSRMDSTMTGNKI